jgi:hypothetical protein
MFGRLAIIMAGCAFISTNTAAADMLWVRCKNYSSNIPVPTDKKFESHFTRVEPLDIFLDTANNKGWWVDGDLLTSRDDPADLSIYPDRYYLKKSTRISVEWIEIDRVKGTVELYGQWSNDIRGSNAPSKLGYGDGCEKMQPRL